MEQMNEMRMAYAAEGAVVQGKEYRFTVLTDCMIRMEYQKDGRFTDTATQVIANRAFPVPEFRVIDGEEQLEIVTEKLHLYYNRKPFSAEGLTVELKKGFAVYGSIWHYGDEVHDLGGTARTLDNADGAIPLEHGLLSTDGFTLLDDSKSALLTADGWVQARGEESIDLYFLGYGHSYLDCLRDFYQLSGATPLLPRYALGNWWSRFFWYTEESYLELMDRFQEKSLPFSTAVLDMGWHITDVPEKYGSGWTGYTWNKNLFPDPARFMGKLHEKGLRVTLNVHPADGVRAFEEAYPEMARALGVDYENEDKIVFDAADREFMDAYFKYLHHPNEKDGVDFWWIDWQQGSTSSIPGIDTLWLLNHLHFIDSSRDGKRPLTFSRYAGIGSHRYPIGFSGDTISNWESLAFQPYFTATASNAGYSWWSHDIGGHQRGRKDDELMVRWAQFGVFSPIMRLHSTCNIFYGKEPWNYNMEAEKTLTEFLQLRHKMIPYLYTMNELTHSQGLPLMQPMYYHYEDWDSYTVPNEYFFGTEMIVCPVTKPADKATLLAETDCWLPEGTYHDFFTGLIYRGTKKMKLYRDQSIMPVLVKAGGIIPMAADYMDSHLHNPALLEVHVYAGADGSFRMYEDDCKEMVNAAEAWTAMQFDYSRADGMAFSVQTEGCTEEVIPKNRSYRVVFHGVQAPTEAAVSGEYGCEWTYDKKQKTLTVETGAVGAGSVEITVKLEDKTLASPEMLTMAYEILRRAQISYDTKERVYRILENQKNPFRLMADLHDAQIEDSLMGALIEIISAEA